MGELQVTRPCFSQKEHVFLAPSFCGLSWSHFSSDLCNTQSVEKDDVAEGEARYVNIAELFSCVVLQFLLNTTLNELTYRVAFILLLAMGF